MKTLKALLYLILLIPVAVYTGWVGVTLWGWFVLPIFPAAPKLNIPEVMGLIILIRYFISSPKLSDWEDNDFPWDIFLAFGYPTIALIGGWIYSLFL